MKFKLKVVGVSEIQAGLRDVKREVSGPIVQKGVQVGCRRTVPRVRQNLARNRQTSATSRSIGVKVQRFTNGQGAVGLVGPRRYHRMLHPAFGYRSRGLWRQTHPGTTDPAKIMHLIEGGHKAIVPTKAKVLAIVVARLDARRKDRLGTKSGPIVIPGGDAMKLGKKPSKPKRVPGGFLIFAKFSKAAQGTKPMERSQPALASNVISGVADTVRSELPKLAAQAAARGRSIFRG